MSCSAVAFGPHGPISGPTDELNIFFGIQGAIHVELEVDAVGFSKNVLLTTEFFDESGASLSRTETTPVLFEATDAETCAGPLDRIQAVFEDPTVGCDLGGTTLRVVVELERSDGTVATCETRGVVVLEEPILSIFCYEE